MSMPGKSGIELIKQVHAESPKLRILVLCMHEEHQYAVRAIRAGAAGYITKDSAARQLVAAIRKVAGGWRLHQRGGGRQLALGAMPGAQGQPHERFPIASSRCFRMIAEGRGVSDIAAAPEPLGQDGGTHKANILHEVGMSTANELIRYALTHRLVETGSHRGQAGADSMNSPTACS